MAVRWHIVYPILPRICQIGFTFAQPLMLSRVVEYVAHKDIESPNIGYGLIGAYAIVYTGIAVCPPPPSRGFLHMFSLR